MEKQIHTGNGGSLRNYQDWNIFYEENREKIQLIEKKYSLKTLPQILQNKNMKQDKKKKQVQTYKHTYTRAVDK